VTPLLQAMTLLLLGSTAARIVLTGEYLRFVKPSLAPWLLVVGAALAVLGLCAARDALTGDHTGRHRRVHSGPRVGMLLLLPVAAVYVVAPPPLGSFAAERTPAREPAMPTDSGKPVPLADAGPDGYRATTLDDYSSRVYWGTEPSYDGERVRLVGFVTPRDGGGWYLTRMQIACCAADGFPIKIFVRDVGGAIPERDSWVQVDGRGVNDVSPDLEADGALAEVVAERVIPVEEPAAPYE
jgi:uncharacterized repeat protein (TIGR03943 family)